MGYNEHYKKKEKQMNLGKKYKQLFEGKVRSNDSKLLKEYRSFELDYEDVLDMDKMTNMFEDYYAAAEDGSDVQIFLQQGEFQVGSGIRKDTVGPALGSEEFLTAKIDKSDPDFYAFEFDKASIDSLKKGGLDAEEVADNLADWSEDEIEYL
jgi:hypothetical protein